MRVALIIPAFDRLRSLETTLMSCKAQRTRAEVEVIVVDDKSPHGSEIRKLSNEFAARYILNQTRNTQERQPALCRNLGYRNSSAEIVIFLDADVLIGPEAVETHIKYLQRPNVATSGQIWSLPGGQDSVNGLKDFSEGRLMRLGEHRPQADVPWSHVRRVNPSDNWWAFLSAHCSFRRADLDGVGGWDESYTGWGVEDNDLGYRANKRGFAFIYAEDLKGFHIDHAMTRDEYLAKCTSALRNLKQFSSKFPEVAQDTRVKSRLEELELIVAGHAAKRDRQETAGGGAITDSPSV